MNNPTIGPNNNPPILIRIPSIVERQLGYTLNKTPISPPLITVNKTITAIEIAITMAMLAILREVNFGKI
jgi:citrate lyase gamma subunit